jgi:uncharacterized protein (TIGR03435 family)
VLDPRRLDANHTTAHALILWAYGLDCTPWRGSDVLFGGAAWTKEDGFDVQAIIPEGTPAYTNPELHAHKAPELQKMLQTMLLERFKLALHREAREVDAYVLSVAKGGPRMVPSPIGKKADVEMVTLSNGNVVRAPGMAPVLSGLSVWKEGDDDCCTSTTPEGISAVKQPIAHLAKRLAFILGKPVIDRTDLTGNYNFGFVFEPTYPPGLPGPSGAARPAFLPPPDTRSVFRAIEQDLGLKIEAGKEKIEVLVIDHIERPTEN